MTVQEMLEDIRRTIARCGAAERQVYEALVDEAEGWQMRLEEMEEEEDDSDDDDDE